MGREWYEPIGLLSWSSEVRSYSFGWGIGCLSSLIQNGLAVKPHITLNGPVESVVPRDHAAEQEPPQPNSNLPREMVLPVLSTIVKEGATSIGSLRCGGSLSLPAGM